MALALDRSRKQCHRQESQPQMKEARLSTMKNKWHSHAKLFGAGRSVRGGGGDSLDSLRDTDIPGNGSKGSKNGEPLSRPAPPPNRHSWQEGTLTADTGGKYWNRSERPWSHTVGLEVGVQCMQKPNLCSWVVWAQGETQPPSDRAVQWIEGCPIR